MFHKLYPNQHNKTLYTYKAVFVWLQNNRGSIEEMQKFATWQDVFNNIGSRYDRIWSDEEEKQGYLNN